MVWKIFLFAFAGHILVWCENADQAGSHLLLLKTCAVCGFHRLLSFASWQSAEVRHFMVSRAAQVSQALK
jgi:hypothetical protein